MARLDRLPPYLFAEIDAARERALAAGTDVIDLGVGDPDRPTPRRLLEVAAVALKDPSHHRYPAGRGSKRVREVIARYMRRRFGVEVDAEREVVVLLGSKEGIAHLPLAVTEPGDAVLVPDPGYPVYTQGAVLAGVEPIAFSLPAERAFLPDPVEIEARANERVKLLWLNYPNNPTGAEAGAGLLRPLLNLAGRRGWILANDAAYVEMSLDGHRPVSLLEAADHRQQQIIEFHSLSKTFNMTGWRVGFAVGHADVVGALARAKQTIDSGTFGAIQEVAAFALGDVCEELLAEVLKPYPRRRTVIVEALALAGIEVFPTAATFYVWARVPGDETSLAFCARLLKSTGVVATPGVGFGANGEGWFRLSLTAPDARIDDAAGRLRGL
jgi:LL-diaminopimelate aminotransferase